MKLDVTAANDQAVYLATKGVGLPSFEGYLSTWLAMKKLGLSISLSGYKTFLVNIKSDPNFGIKSYKNSTLVQKRQAVIYFEKATGQGTVNIQIDLIMSGMHHDHLEGVISKPGALTNDLV